MPTPMIERNLSRKLQELVGYYPMVAVTGPRQSGKTTPCRTTSPDKPYVSLETVDTRAFALPWHQIERAAGGAA